MAKKKYYIHLKDDERDHLMRIVCEEKENKRTVMRARILLMSEATQYEKVSIRELAERLGTSDTTIQTVRTEYATEGLESALYRKKRINTQYNRKINDEVIVKIKEIAASEPPVGQKRWTTRMLCEEVKKRGILDHIVSSTMSKILNS